ncbi:MAG TPA: hypothetical protein DEB10_07755 [Ruminococcaceae bacterium]|nr:hypothetical protein [Oscillospiraceae bacterium]
MLKLSNKNFLKARDYIFANSDDINRAWFKYNFEGKDTSAFLDALAKYQHEDGGFGGLVYEFEYQGPCLKCTEHAFCYMFYLKDKPSADHPVVQKMMKYVLGKYRPDVGHFGQMEEPSLNEQPHVRWWEYNADECPPIADEDERILKYSPNGQAGIVAFIAQYSELVPGDLYQDIIKYPVEKILRYYDKESPLYGTGSVDDSFEYDDQSPYNLKCFQKFVACLKDKPLADKLTKILCQNPTACMQLDLAKWEQGYEELPCDVVDTPDSIVYPAVKGLVDDSLGYLIRQQNDDGCWHLHWSFGEGEALAKLQSLYEAHITMLILAELGRFGRIER